MQGSWFDSWSGSSSGEGIGYLLKCSWASLVAQMVKNPPAMWETWVQSLGWEDPLEEGMATHSSILAWRIPRDRGAWRATVHRVAKSPTQVRLSVKQRQTHRRREQTVVAKGLGAERGGDWEFRISRCKLLFVCTNEHTRS